MDAFRRTAEGYGSGFLDGWRSAAGRYPIPPHIAIIPSHVVPVDMTFYEYGYQKGREEAQRVKAH
jgi:hypothetical protein